MKYQYIKSSWPDGEKTWLCAACRETHREQIEAARWRLISVTTDSNILCDACDHFEGLVKRPASAFALVRAFLLALH